jgi:hypothetical protein
MKAFEFSSSGLLLNAHILSILSKPTYLFLEVRGSYKPEGGGFESR